MSGCPIKGNGYNNVKVDMGILNSNKEPYIIDLGEEIKFLLRYRNSARDDDYGELFFERLAK